MSLIECVPNVSEGRRRDVIERIAGAVRAVPGVWLLDYSADPTHNRSVYTMVGDPAGLHAAVLALAAEAIATIDLRLHRGAHPRIGAVDVVPFVPFPDSTMPECVALAAMVGRSLSDRFNLPIYFYEQAATIAGRTRLEDIRRGQFEGLATKMARAEWRPDLGPPAPHPTAGATAVGARQVLIAYNITLNTSRLDVARRVAAAVRQSGGGLPAVKAIGLSLPDRKIVQVSMNLTNYMETPIQVVFDRVVAEAARDGAEIVDSELIGLIPAAALGSTTAEYLKLRDFSERRILENRLREVVRQ